MTGLATWRVLTRRDPAPRPNALYLACMVLAAALVERRRLLGRGIAQPRLAPRCQTTRSLTIRLLISTFVTGCSPSAARSASAASPRPEPARRRCTAAPEIGSASHGRQLFIQSCAHCHGDDAHGSGEDGDGPDLFRLRIGNARIAAVIRTGIPDEMPSFTKKFASPEIADLTAYLRTLQ